MEDIEYNYQKVQTTHIAFFILNDATVKNKKDIANGFNDFFCKSRTKLSKMH